MFEGAQEIRGSNGVIHDEGKTIAMCHLGDRSNIQDVNPRVGHCFAKKRLRVGLDGCLPRIRVVLVIDEGDLDAEFGKGVLEQVVGTAIDG